MGCWKRYLFNPFSLRADDGASQTSSTTVTINVGNIIDSSPVFDAASYTATLDETSVFGTSIIGISGNVTDDDNNNNPTDDKIQYAVSGEYYW